MKNRCWIGSVDDHVMEGEVIGLLRDRKTEDVSVVVRFAGHGMYVEAFHPSKVYMNDPRESA